ncbi:MAG: cation-transporting P-type ATPase [Clostridia bacterium]|nr:cation-transporting P-type ATPase [Clostridia bacterium]
MARWYDYSPEEAAQSLGSDLYAGLSNKEARRRQNEHGFNVIFPHPIPKGKFFVHLKHITLNPLTILLMLTSVLTAFFGDPATSLIILLLLFVGYASTIFVYVKAQQIFGRMSEYSLPYAKVIRRGELYIIRQENLVPGDIILLSPGDIVPADARLIHTQDLYLIESGITDAKGSIRKDASYQDYHNLEPHEQINMVFASTIVARGRGRAIVCRTGDDTLVCQSHKNRPAVRYDKLDIFDKLYKTSYLFSLFSILAVFVLTLVNLLTHQWEILTGFVTMLALSVAALSEFYAAFSRILVASGIFNSIRQEKNGTKGALIKNADKLSTLSKVTTVFIPPEILISERDMRLVALMTDGTEFHDYNPKTMEAPDTNLLRYAILSTGIYGTDRLVELHRAGEADFTFEEDAILKAGQKTGVWSPELSHEYRLMEHCRREDSPYEDLHCDLTLTKHNDQKICIVRGDPKQILELCSHYTDESGRPRRFTGVHRQQILTLTQQKMRGGYQLTAIATALTESDRIADLGKLDRQLTFEGLLTLEQPMLPGCAKTVSKLKDAGIRVILFSPEEGERYTSLAESLGIIESSDKNSITAGELSQLSEEDLLKNFKQYSLYQGLSLSKRRTILKLWKAEGETILYVGRELSEITIIRDADVGATQALTLAGKVQRKLSSPTGQKVSVQFNQSVDGALNGCDALRFVADVVLSMVEEDGSGGLNALADSICTARSTFRNLHRMASYLTASISAKLVITLIGFLFGCLWLTPVQMLFWGMIVDLFVILTLALSSPSDELPRKNAIAARAMADKKLDERKYLLRVIALSGCVGVVLAISQLLIALLSLIWKVNITGQSSLIFLSTLPSMAILLWETGRSGDLRRQKITVSRMFFFAAIAVIGFMVLCFTFPLLGTPFGLGAFPMKLLPLALIPPVLLFLICEGLHRILGDL